MEKPILKNKEIFPAKEVLAGVLKNSFPAFEELVSLWAEQGINPEWRYYHDGNAWLCKMPFKKKNLGWLAVYDGYFHITFYFLERHMEQIAELEISEDIKKEFFQNQSTGKLIPLSMKITDTKQIKEVMTVLALKKIVK